MNRGQGWKPENNVFLVKQGPGPGPEQRESGKTVLYPRIIIIIIILISYISLLNYKFIK